MHFLCVNGRQSLIQVINFNRYEEHLKFLKQELCVIFLFSEFVVSVLNACCNFVDLLVKGKFCFLQTLAVIALLQKKPANYFLQSETSQINEIAHFRSHRCKNFLLFYWFVVQWGVEIVYQVHLHVRFTLLWLHLLTLSGQLQHEIRFLFSFFDFGFFNFLNLFNFWFFFWSLICFGFFFRNLWHWFLVFNNGVNWLRTSFVVVQNKFQVSDRLSKC